jgi:hypothetical protein
MWNRFSLVVTGRMETYVCVSRRIMQKKKQENKKRKMMGQNNIIARRTGLARRGN